MLEVELRQLVDHLEKCGFAVKPAHKPALGKWVTRETDVEALAWLSEKQASSCIEKLKKWNQRIIRIREAEFTKAWGLASPGQVRDVVFQMARKHLRHGATAETLSKI